MATGDVTSYGPYTLDVIANVKTELEADGVVVADKFVVLPFGEGVCYIVRIEA